LIGERVERRLAAILAADVAGYSRLMGHDEEGTLNRFNAHRRELIDPKIAEHRGRIVKTTGDGLLAEFASVVDAVRCAVELQRGMIERNSEEAEDRRIALRVGVNLGDIIVEGRDIFGDGVNIAARLESLAEPGGICISRTVRNQVRDKLPYGFDDIGEQSVKNIARPVRADAMSAAAVAATPLVPVPIQPAAVRPGSIRTRNIIVAGLVAVIGMGLGAWWVWPHTGSVLMGKESPPSAATAAKPVPRLSIVVLPFTNLSNDADQEYFADSITDDLTTDLSRIQDSFVIARNTAFTYKGKPVDVKQIGHDLGVRYVLEGSVRRLGETVQINVQLIDAESGAHLWAERFDTDRTNLAKAQDEITGRLAWTLHVELVTAASRQIKQEVNPDARDLVLRGWARYWQTATPESAQQAQQAFEQALALDPQSVEARVGIAGILVENVIKRWSKSPQQDTARAEQLLREALDRDSNHARANFVMGTLLGRVQRRLAESKIALEKAIALDPNSPGAHHQLGYTLIDLGQPEVALPQFEKAIQLNPKFQNIVYYYAGAGFCHLLLGDKDQAVDYLRKAYAENPRLWYIPLWLAAALGYRGDIDEAKAALAEFLKMKPDWNSVARIKADITRDPVYIALVEKTEFAGLRAAGLPEQ
jgi:TolB-like protein/class 3 adenylate cyclase/Tfp pilus assembly protein PilF